MKYKMMIQAEAAKFAGVHRQTIYNWIASGKLDTYTVKNYKVPFISEKDLINNK